LKEKLEWSRDVFLLEAGQRLVVIYPAKEKQREWVGNDVVDDYQS
jgi:hypothetical protein